METELLEREFHLAQLEEHRKQAAAGHGRLVLVSGEAGVGKSTLANEFCRRLEDAHVVRTSCDALATPSPLAPLRDLAPALGIPIEHDVHDSESREQLFRAVLDRLAAGPKPTVIIGEDAHWADGATLEMVRFISRRVEGLRLLCFVTYRDDEIGPTHPLRLILGDLPSSQTVYRLPPSPLKGYVTPDTTN